MKTFIFLFLFCFSSFFSQNNKNYYSEISISKLNNLKQDCYSEIYREYFNDIVNNITIQFTDEREVISFNSNGIKTDVNVFDLVNGFAVATQNNKKYCYYNELGKQITAYKYDYEATEVYNNNGEGRAVIKLNGKYGFIDINGKEIIPPIYDAVDEFSNGLSVVKLNGKYGIINELGNVVIPFGKYDDFKYRYTKGFCVCNLNSKYGLLDSLGNEIIPVGKYDYIDITDFGLFAVNKNNKYGFVNKYGKEVAPIIYDNYSTFWKANYVLVDLNGKKSIIDKNGKIISTTSKKYIINGFIEEIAKFSFNGKEGVLDKYFNEIIPVGKYDIISNIYGNRAIVEKDGLKGVIDNTGQEIIPLGKYDWSFERWEENPNSVINFVENLSKVCRNKKYGFIDKNYKESISLIYDKVEDFSEGLSAVKLNGKYGYIDKYNKVIIPFEYDLVSSFLNGIAMVSKNSKVGFINTKGDEVVSFKFDLYYNVESGSTHLPDVNKNGIYIFYENCELKLLKINTGILQNTNHQILNHEKKNESLEINTSKNDVSKTRTHEVKLGDNLGKIAEKYHVKIDALIKINKIEDYKINIGQILIIP